MRPRSVALALALAVSLAGCSGGGQPRASTTPDAGSRPPAPAAQGAVCPPLSQFLLASRLLGVVLQQPVKPLYARHVVDTGAKGLHDARPLVTGTIAADVDVQSQYWAAVQQTFADVGYVPTQISGQQADALQAKAEMLHSAPAGDRLVAYAKATCGEGVEPTPQQLGAFR